MLKVKRTVRPKSIWIAAAIINAAIELGFTVDMLITAGRDGKHMPGSKHYTDEALDFRTKHLSPADKAALVSAVGLRLGASYDVILEGLGTASEHGHAEYDPVRPNTTKG